MRTVLVLGAGASLAEAESFRKRGAHPSPPLDYTFFQKVRELKIPVPSALMTYAKNLPGDNAFVPHQNRPPYRLEEFFKDVFFDFQQDPDSEALASAYEQLCRLYRNVLLQTTNWMNSMAFHYGPVSRLLVSAIRSSARIDIITFNHDAVIENEFPKTRFLRRRWCLEKGYGRLADTLNFLKSDSPALPAHNKNCVHDPPIRILKLHGSLNWYVRMRGRHPTTSLLLGAQAPARIYVTRRRTLLPTPRFRVRREGPGRHSWDLWPVVVPPVYSKEALLRGLQIVWEEAQEALLEADRVVIFGYSLPLLDVQAEKLFQRALSNNVNLKRVEIINPSPDASDRFARLVPTRPLTWFPRMHEFLQEEQVAS